MEKSVPPKLRVIIVGAGITGLALANIFKEIGIDFVLLEAHANIEQPAGGSFGIWPNAARILDQLGCWDDVRSAGGPIEANHLRSPDGQILMSNNISKVLQESFGYETMALERHNLIEILHRHLGADHNVQCEERVVNIIEEHDTVRVLLADNSEVSGDIVVGCDGVHSIVRQFMWENANKKLPETINVSEKKAIMSAYRCLVGVAPLIPGLALNELNVIQGQGLSMTIVTQPEKTMFFACIKEKVAFHWPRRVSFSAEDAETEAAKIADTPITANTLFGEVWNKRQRGYLCSIQEGLLSHWYFGRMVLVGDSVHKLSPIGAHSGNCAIESAAALANALNDHVLRLDKGKLGTEVITSAFESYQRKRADRVKKFFDSTYLLTRMHTWDTYWHFLLGRYVLRWMGGTRSLKKLMLDAEKVQVIDEPGRAKGFAGMIVGDEPANAASSIGHAIRVLKSVCQWLRISTKGTYGIK